MCQQKCTAELYKHCVSLGVTKIQNVPCRLVMSGESLSGFATILTLVTSESTLGWVAHGSTNTSTPATRQQAQASSQVEPPNSK